MAEHKTSADEQLHDKAKGTDGMKTVYDNQPADQRKQAAQSAEQDEGLEESFPASDAPAPSDPTSAPAPAKE